MMLSLAVLCSVVASTDGGTPTAHSSPASAMREAFEALLRLQAADAKALSDPQQTARFSADLKRLSDLAHVFPQDARAQEPATAALSSLLARYAVETQRRLEQFDQSVGPRVRTLTGLCFTCHTRERAAGDFADALHRLDALGLTGIERASVLAATRQFDAALAEYQRVMDAPATTYSTYARAFQDSLTLLVRVKDDPTAAMALLDRVEAKPGLPLFFRVNLPLWKKDVSDWRGEHFDPTRAKPEVLFARAKALVSKAGSAPLFADERKDVLWLRASGYLNLALAKNPALPLRGEALELMGLCAGGLRSPLWWDVDQLYFEACVRENPKTQLARRCLAQLSERVTLGYSGSAGTFIPDDELERLAALRVIANGR